MNQDLALGFYHMQNVREGVKEGGRKGGREGGGREGGREGGRVGGGREGGREGEGKRSFIGHADKLSTVHLYRYLSQSTEHSFTTSTTTHLS